jgi:hypothetical protein
MAGIEEGARALPAIRPSRGDGMTDERKGRRGLLGMVGLAAGTAAGSAAAFAPDGGRGNIPAQPETEEEKRKPRYRETDHVRDFYRTNRS